MEFLLLFASTRSISVVTVEERQNKFQFQHKNKQQANLCSIKIMWVQKSIKSDDFRVMEISDLRTPLFPEGSVTLKF